MHTRKASVGMYSGYGTPSQAWLENTHKHMFTCIIIPRIATHTLVTHCKCQNTKVSYITHMHAQADSVRYESRTLQGWHEQVNINRCMIIEKSKHRGCIVDFDYPYNSCYVLFSTAISTSSFNFYIRRMGFNCIV